MVIKNNNTPQANQNPQTKQIQVIKWKIILFQKEPNNFRSLPADIRLKPALAPKNRSNAQVSKIKTQ